MRKLFGLGLALLAASAPALAQEVPRERAPRADSVSALDLPDAVADAVVDFHNDPGRARYRGPARIAPGDTLRRDVAVLEGPLEVAGRIEGSVVAVNSDVRLRPGSAITGDLLVVGGVVEGLDSAAVEGEIVSYSERLEYRSEGDRIARVRPRVTRGERGTTQPRWGRGDFLLTTGKSYNRVEGLPITFGPRVSTAGKNPLRLHALAVYRTESGFTLDAERMGYYVRAEQYLGGRRELRVGAAAHSLVDPIEEWHLSDLENGLATFLFHEDFRDHYEREGVSTFVAWDPRPSPLALSAELLWERHGSLAVGSPLTLFDNADPWRPQPLIAEGDFGSLALQASWDSRSEAPDPSTGWYARGRIEQAVRTDLARPRAFVEAPAPPGSVLLEPQAYDRFLTGLIDLRRYNRVDPESRLNFRLVAGGSLDGSPLPPQRQHALGGEGSLPGYDLFALDCGARARPVYRSPERVGAAVAAFFPRYGCDAFALLQTEFRGKLDFRLRLDSAPWEGDEPGWGLGWDVSPDWTIFLDAGRAWAFDERTDEELRVDVGAGILVNRFGIYLAKSLTGSNGVNAFVRLGPRF